LKHTMRNAMSVNTDRRTTLVGFGAALMLAGSSSESAQATTPNAKAPQGAELAELTDRLRRSPRRRDFKTVPMILENPEFWDSAALKEVIAYKGAHKQAWDNTQIAGPWLNVMRNSLNSQIVSFRHPNFLVVSATHGAAHLALYDQQTWDKYKLADMTSDAFKTNTLIVRKHASADASNPEDPASLFGPAGNTIPALQDRGVVFMACHNAIWELADKLRAKDVNPDGQSHEALAAELTNHLIDGVVLTPGIVATLVELQGAGFHYAS
jgi:intracellular sulfur oxidation DsrE/DsrF family protein